MPTAKNKSAIPDEIIKQYDLIITSVKTIERKGATMPYTSLNGNMFSFLNREGKLCLRLNESDRAAIIKKYKTHLCKENGTLLKEYIYVPDKLFSDTKTVLVWFKKSYEYVTGLKPKPTKRK